MTLGSVARCGGGFGIVSRRLLTLLGVTTIAACDGGSVSGEQRHTPDANDATRVAEAGVERSDAQTVSTQLADAADVQDVTSLDVSLDPDSDVHATSISLPSALEAGVIVSISDAGTISSPVQDASAASTDASAEAQATASTVTGSRTNTSTTTSLDVTNSTAVSTRTSTDGSFDSTSSESDATQTAALGSSATTTDNPSGEDATSGYPPFEMGPPAGNPEGQCVVAEDARLEDVSQPDHVIGTGSPSSCTADAFIDAVAQGGAITFDCGPEPVVITLDRPAKVFNNANPDVTIDGGGLVTLSGGGTTRILYMNTCDEAQVWTTPNCDNQDHPRLSVQNLTFIDGNSKNETEFTGGGAIYASGGRFKVINSRFFNNVCDDDGPDVGGAGIRVFQQYNSLPAYVVNSTFGGAPELGNVCSNGGGISSIGVSWTVLNSVFSYNQAIGFGGNPPDPDTLGGGSGGAIYNDGATMTLTLCGSVFEHNDVNMYGSSIFFVSNSHTGSIFISSTISRYNTGGGWDALLPGISMHEDTYVSVDDASIIE